MLIRVAADDEILEEGGLTGRDVSWTLSASQPFAVSIPALKRMLRVATASAGFREHGYRLFTCSFTREGHPRPELEVDLEKTPDYYNLRSGCWVHVCRTRVARLVTRLEKQTAQCKEPFHVTVLSTDGEGNARALPSGGRLRLFADDGTAARAAPKPGSRDEKLLGPTTQGTGDGKQVEFHFDSVSVEHAGVYRITAEHVARPGQPVAADEGGGGGGVLSVEALPHPSLQGLVGSHVGRYAIRIHFTADAVGLVGYVVYRDEPDITWGTPPQALGPVPPASFCGETASLESSGSAGGSCVSARVGAPGGLAAAEVMRAGREALARARRERINKGEERGVEEGEGVGVLPGALACGLAETSVGPQHLDVLLRVQLNPAGAADSVRYRVVLATDNLDCTNTAPRTLTVVVAPREAARKPPVLSGTDVFCTTGGGRGGVKFSFDSDDAGHVAYVLSEVNTYHPVDPADVIGVVQQGSHRERVANHEGIAGKGMFSVGFGLGHTVFLPASHLAAGTTYDFWWVAGAPDAFEGCLGGGGAAVHPELRKITVVVPFEDAPGLTAVCALQAAGGGGGDDAKPGTNTETVDLGWGWGEEGVTPASNNVHERQAAPDHETKISPRAMPGLGAALASPLGGSEDASKLVLRVHFAIDAPGTVHYVVREKLKGRVEESPLGIVRLATEDDERVLAGRGVASAGAFRGLSSGPHTFLIAYPVPKDQEGWQRTPGPLLPGTPYELFMVADNTHRNNPSLRVVRAPPVTLTRPLDSRPQQQHTQHQEGLEHQQRQQHQPLDESDQQRQGRAGLQPASPSASPATLPVSPALRCEPPPVADLARRAPAISQFADEDWTADVSEFRAFFSHGSREAQQLLQQALDGTATPSNAPTDDLRVRFVKMQQRVLDLESTLKSCEIERKAASDEAAFFDARLRDLLQKTEAQRRIKAELDSYVGQAEKYKRDPIAEECRDIARELAEVEEGDAEWSVRIRDAEACNVLLQRLLQQVEQKRTDYVRELRERCVQHKAQIKAAPNYTEQVLALRKVREEQDAEIDLLTRILRRMDPPKEDVKKPVRKAYLSLREAEPQIVTRRLLLPKGGLRVLTTMQGNGLQALRYKYHVSAEVVAVHDDHNELHVTGELANVVDLLQDVERIYKNLKLEMPGPRRVEAAFP